MFHWQIFLGLAGGIAEILWETGAGRETAVQLAGLAVRVVGTCAVFYALFLCRMLGAGDIKLMALCTGLLGMGPGLRVIFSGLLLAALRAAGMIWKQGSLWLRMERIGSFGFWNIRGGRTGEISCGWGPGCSWDTVYGCLPDISEEVREYEKDHGGIR